MKINMGWIANNKGVKKEIIVNQLPLSVKDYMLCLIMGPFGIFRAANKAFENGVNAMDKAEHEVLSSLDLVE